MILSDGNILERLERPQIGRGHDLVIEPLDLLQIQPASIDLTLGTRFVTFGVAGPEPKPIDLSNPNAIRSAPKREVDTDCIGLPPGAFALGITVERVEIPYDLVGRIEGRSSLARLGLLPHVAAGYIDPGFRGHITLELLNVSPHHLLVHAGLRICQMSLHRCLSPAIRPYGHERRQSHYQDAPDHPVTSRFDNL